MVGVAFHQRGDRADLIGGNFPQRNPAARHPAHKTGTRMERQQVACLREHGPGGKQHVVKAVEESTGALVMRVVPVEQGD
jgi:hypothetical protein